MHGYSKKLVIYNLAFIMRFTTNRIFNMLNLLHVCVGKEATYKGIFIDVAT